MRGMGHTSTRRVRCRSVLQMARSAAVWVNGRSRLKVQQTLLVSCTRGHGVWVSGGGASAELANCMLEGNCGCGVLCEGATSALVRAQSCKTRGNGECGYKAAAGGRIEALQCESSGEVHKVQEGSGRVSGGSLHRTRLGWLRGQLEAGVATGAWLRSQLQQHLWR